MRYADNYCTYTEAMNPHRYIYTGQCKINNSTYTVEVPAEELYAYRQGAMAQDAFKSLLAEEREFLISGTTPAGWFELFPPEQNTLMILQGVPGSGKSAFARKLMTKTINAVIVSTDEWHHDLTGKYTFNRDKIAAFHQAAQQKCRVLLKLGCAVILDNTNILNAHIKPYVQMAVEMGVAVKFCRLEGNFESSHNVPPEIIKRMRETMEDLSVEKALASEGIGGKRS